MSYGTPAGRADVEPYYTDIRRGRAPTPEALADLVRRYDAIGGVSPLAEITAAQRLALVAALDRIEPGCFEVRLGFKHAHPKVEETARGLVDDGFRRIVGLVLAPHFSSGSIGGYLAQLGAGASADGVDLRAIESWATEPAYVRYLADDLAVRLAAMRPEIEAGTRPMVLFTAHALPQRVIDGGDPYVDELRSTAEAVASVLGLAEGDDWEIAWQSAGRTPEPWIGPDVLEVLDRLGQDHAVGGVVVCACGFVADHLEVLYDLDIEAAGTAAASGLAFARTASVADDATVMAALASRVHALSGDAPAAPRRAP